MRVLIATEHAGVSIVAGHRAAVDGELVAPDRTVGERSGFGWGPERVAALVEGPVGGPAGAWAGGWVGLASSGVTDSALIADRPGVTPADLRRRVRDWIEGCGLCGGEEPVDVLVEAHLAEMTEVCLAFPIGTIITRRGGGIISVRRHAA